MIPTLTTTNMRAIDEEAIGGHLEIGYAYMLKAGMGLFEAIPSFLTSRSAGQIAIICGKGNNGGDGFVVGKLLHENGYKVLCMGVCPGESLTGEAREAFDEYRDKKGPFAVVSTPEDLSSLSSSALIIDALLGTGITGNPRGQSAWIIEAMNASGKPILAVDTPSGLDNDTGIPGTPTVKASRTVTMGFPKIGQLFYPGRSCTGMLTVTPLGYPDSVVANHHDAIWLPTRQSVAGMIPRRRPAGSKFDHGLALIVAGSPGMTGSATLAAQAALRTGCGMVHMAIPQSILSVLSQKLTEPVLHPMPVSDTGSLGSGAADAIGDLSKRMQALCIGPGLSCQGETAAVVRTILEHSTVPVVLDADGLNVFKGAGQDLSNTDRDIIITPHAGEWKRLFGALPEKPLERIDAVRTIAQEYHLTIVLKGNPVIIATPMNQVFVVPVGNSGLATAGTGDVLSGILVSLLAQGCTVADAAVAGTLLHGCAGESASAALTEYSMTASDCIDALPAVIASFVKPSDPGIFPDTWQ